MILPEVKDLLKNIPKQYHKAILKIGIIYYKEGVKDIKSLIGDISNLPNDRIKEYGIWHEDCLDGG